MVPRGIDIRSYAERQRQYRDSYLPVVVSNGKCINVRTYPSN